MRIIGDIKTIGLSPCWDTVCRLRGIDWGDHKLVDSTTVRPAGKAMNISWALAWIGRRHTAAGLWGGEDIHQAERALRPLRQWVRPALTEAAGATRRNVTVVDTLNRREMHLRNLSTLATAKSLRRLGMHLRTMVRRADACVFAGMMPDESLAADVDRVIQTCRAKGAAVAVDTSGPALQRIVDGGGLWLIKPNVAELCELVGQDLTDRTGPLAKAAAGLLEKVQSVLVTRGAGGAVLVMREGAWQGRVVGRRKAAYTVGCGDYFLAGFLDAAASGKTPAEALAPALTAGTARAWGLAETMTWQQACQNIATQITPLGGP